MSTTSPGVLLLLSGKNPVLPDWRGSTARPFVLPSLEDAALTKLKKLRPVLPDGVRYYRATRKTPPTGRFGGGVFIPFFYLEKLSTKSTLSPPFLRSFKPLDLSILPPKLVDSWRIEGEGQDLHLHQADLLFPLIHLRDLSLGFPCGKPRHLVAYLCVL